MIILSWDIGKSKRNIIELQKKCLDAQILDEIVRTIDSLPDGAIVRKLMLIQFRLHNYIKRLYCLQSLQAGDKYEPHPY